MRDEMSLVASVAGQEIATATAADQLPKRACRLSSSLS